MKLMEYFPELKKFDNDIQPILEAVYRETYKKRKKISGKNKAVVSAKAEAMSEAIRLVSQDNLKRIKDRFEEEI